jgi:lactate dehydrogenase-like 2-hydroxyacid dehydrogenase
LEDRVSNTLILDHKLRKITAARVAQAMGMEVYAYTASKKETTEERSDHGYIVPGTGDPDGSIPTKWFSGTEKADLHEFLSQDIDILVVSVPLTFVTQFTPSTD